MPIHIWNSHWLHPVRELAPLVMTREDLTKGLALLEGAIG